MNGVLHGGLSYSSGGPYLEILAYIIRQYCGVS